MAVNVEKDGPVTTVILSRPEVRNAVDRETAAKLSAAFRVFESDASARVAVFTGDQGHFCAGADLKKQWPTNSNTGWHRWQKNPQRGLPDLLRGTVVMVNSNRLQRMQTMPSYPLVQAAYWWIHGSKS